VPPTQPPNNAAASDPLLTMPQVAQVLNVPEYTARELGRRGELPIVRIGRSVRVRSSTLQAFIAARENSDGLHPRETGTVGPRLPGRER
jgi:excisionase family DNA binding protein